MNMEARCAARRTRRTSLTKLILWWNLLPNGPPLARWSAEPAEASKNASKLTEAAPAEAAASKYLSKSTEDVHHVSTGIDIDEDEDYFSRFSVADDDNHDDCIGNDRRDSSAPIPLELVKGVCYAKSYQLRRGDPCSGDVHYHKIVVNAARDAFYVDGVKKSMDVPQNKSFMESLWRRDLPDEFQGDGVHKIKEIYLQDDKMWEAPEEKRVVVVEPIGPDEMM